MLSNPKSTHFKEIPSLKHDSLLTPEMISGIIFANVCRIYCHQNVRFPEIVFLVAPKERMTRRKRSAKEVTIKDVAEAANVSYSTVSRVVNDKEYVKPETRTRVLQVMTRLGYQVNLHARSLAGGFSRVIGLLVLDLATQYIGEIIRGIDDVLASSQYDLLLYTTHRRKTKESTYVNMMTCGMSEGLLLILPRHLETYLESLRDKDFPYMLIDHTGLNENDPAVTATNKQGASEATQHLIDLGHRRIGFVTGILDMSSAQDRLAGYKETLSCNGITLNTDLIVTGDFEQHSGFEGANELLDLPEPPTAIFASNDVSAMGVMNAIQVRGLRIPEDISVIGFDNIPMSNLTHPPLTTIQQPLSEMGRKATEALLAMIDSPENGPKQKIVLPTELVCRQSTAAPSGLVAKS